MQVIIQENGRIIQTLGIMEFPAYVRKFYTVPGDVLDTPHDLVDFFNEKSTACTAVVVEDGDDEVTAVADPEESNE